jgi:hypothetical protein
MENTGQTPKRLHQLSLRGLVGLRLLQGMSFLWITLHEQIADAGQYCHSAHVP